jgi:hypothetical protein
LTRGALQRFGMLLALVCVLARLAKAPGQSPFEYEVRSYAGLKPAFSKQVQLPLPKQGLPPKTNLRQSRGIRNGCCAIFGSFKERLPRVVAVSLCEGLVESGQFR